MNDITSFKTLVGSLYKKYNKASVTGKLDLKTLYLLDIVNEFLYDCPTCLNDKTRHKLESLAIKLQHIDKDICIYRENRNLYTNVNGNDLISLNNNVLNNTPIKVINTAPIIEDPEEYNPPIGLPPFLCEIEKRINLDNFSKILLLKENLANCFKDLNSPTGSVQYLKILSLPLYNPLTYQGIPVYIGQIIDMNTLNTSSNALFYHSNITQDIIDSFTYTVSTSSFPSIYSEEIVTMIITIGTP